MKTIGMLGGMSWESTTLYYRKINEETRKSLGGFHSAPIAMVSVDFQEIETLQHEDNWAACADILADSSRRIEAAGADLLQEFIQVDRLGGDDRRGETQGDGGGRQYFND